MLKRKFKRLGELGSMMVEAMAMLGLISMVTPIIYKKAAERNMEIQDVNAAAQMRNLIKSVDEYVVDNYRKIANGEKVEYSECAVDEVDYAGFTGDSTGEHINVDIRHFCKYLPYGFLDSSGNVADSKLFASDYVVSIKKVDNTDPTNPDVKKIYLTGFVVANPKQADFPRVRTSRISSMVGGNGGFINAQSEGSTTQSAFGVQGMWGVDDIDEELGITGIENGAIIAASVNPIAHGGSNDDDVLYRTEQVNVRRNTMETTLWMGMSDGEGQNIERINQAIIAAGNVDNMSDVGSGEKIDRALWIQGKAGAFIDGMLSVAANSTDTPAFNVNMQGEIYAAGTEDDGAGGYTTTGKHKFVIDKDGAVKASDGKFLVDKDGAVKAAVRDVDDGMGNTTATAFFEVDKDGNLKTKGNAEIEKDLRVHGYTEMGNKTGPFDQNYKHVPGDPFELTVNGDAEIKGILYMLRLKSRYVDAQILRAGTDDVMREDNKDYALYVDEDRLSFGEGDTDDGDKGRFRRFVVDTDGNTTIRSGDLVVTQDNTATDDPASRIFKVINSEGYTYTKGLRGGQEATRGGGDTYYPLEVTNDNLGDVIMSLRNINSGIIGYDSNDNELFEFTNNYSMVQKTNLDKTSRSGSKFEDNLATLSTEVAGVSSTLKIHSDTLTMDVTSGDAVENVELLKSTTQADSADLALRKSSSVRVYGDDTSPVLYIDPNAVDKDSVLDRTADANSKGGVYIRRGVIELEGNYESEGKYLKPDFVAGTADKGYIRADMLISQTAEDALARNKYFYSAGDIPGGSTQYDSYMVNPAYTSVMHDIKLTSRGGARLSDILPDFINKGIYLADNTYSETTGPWLDITYSVSGGKITASGANECTAPSTPGATIYDCATSPWLGVVPAPQCPPGYQKVIQVFPYGFNISQAGIPGIDSRNELYLHTDPREHYINPDPDSEDIPEALYFQKNTWLRTRAMIIDSQDAFKGWYLLMGYVYPHNIFKEYYNSDEVNRVNVRNDQNDYIWNLFPVYFRELEAFANVYCYFDRKGAGFNSDYVDTSYDQLENFRPVTDKTGATNADRLDDKKMNYKNPW